MLRVLKRMTLSRDIQCSYLALKTLALLARAKNEHTPGKNRQFLLRAGILAIFVDHMRSIDIASARVALKGAVYLSMDLADLVSDAENVQPSADFNVTDYFVHNRASATEVSEAENRVRRLRVLSEATVRDGIPIQS